MPEVLVYFDQGAEAVSAKMAVRELQRELAPDYPVKRVNRQHILQGEVLQEAAALVFPGGLAAVYQRELAGQGCEQIRAFVHRGGSYLGLCAGAYFAAQSFLFEAGTSIEVALTCELGFYPGRVEGSALGNGKFSLETKQGSEVAQLQLTGGGEAAVFYYGGCHFPEGAALPQVEVLAHYDDSRCQGPAIVACVVGEGKAILCGVHPEFNPNRLNGKNPHIAPLLPQMQASEPARRKLFRILLKELGLGLAPENQ